MREYRIVIEYSVDKTHNQVRDGVKQELINQDYEDEINEVHLVDKMLSLLNKEKAHEHDFAELSELVTMKKPVLVKDW